MMHRVLRFRHHLHPRPLDDERLFILGGPDPILIRSRAQTVVAPLLDGQRTIRQVLAEVEAHISPPEALFAVMSLERQGHLVEASKSSLSPDVATFWESRGVSSSLAAERLASASVAVEAVNETFRAPIVDALLRAGVNVEECAALRLVIVDDYLNPALEQIQRRALAEKFQWIPFRPLGSEIWFGPLFRSNEGPCWSCLAARLRIHRPVETYLERKSQPSSTSTLAPNHPPLPPLAATPSTLHAAANLVATRIAQAIVTQSLDELRDLCVFDLLQWSTQTHPVVRFPQCPTCGDPSIVSRRMQSPVELASRPKRFTVDGGHRVSTPTETATRLSPQLSPLTGFVARIEPVASRNHPLRPVYSATYRVCPVHDKPSFDDFHRITLGKGRTVEQARVSALCEAIERHSAVFRGDEPRRRCRIDELGDEAIHPDDLQDFSALQFERRSQINNCASSDNRRIPLPFDPTVAMDWSPVWSLTHSRRRWVPTSYCYSHVPVAETQKFCFLNPNGHAAGNCLEETILQAFLELVERDSVAIWWYNRLPRPRVDLHAFGEPYFTELEAHYQSMGYRLWVLDVTTDLGIPSFVALALHERDGRWCTGFGCHLDAALAIQRALTELNQLFDPSPEGPVPWRSSDIEDPSFLFPSEAVSLRGKDDFRIVRHDDVRDDVLECIARAQAAGLETLVLDQTRPDVDFCAAKVIVPGLRHFWPRFRRGRLYDVPMKMGWLDRPRTESELNPLPLFL